MKLSTREISFVKIGGGIVLLLVMLSAYLIPSLTTIRSLKRNISYYTGILEKAIPLAEKLETINSRIEEQSSRISAAAVSADSFRATLAVVMSKAGIPLSALEVKFSGTIKKGRFQESTYTISGKGLTYAELLELAKAIEGGGRNLTIREANVKPTFESSEYLDVGMKISIISRAPTP